MTRKRVSINISITNFFSIYKRFWISYYGKFIYNFTGKDRTKVKEIIITLGNKETIKRLQNYFLDRNNWLVERSHPLGIFISQINEYRIKKNGAKNGKSKITKHKEFNIATEIKKSKNS